VSLHQVSRKVQIRDFLEKLGYCLSYSVSFNVAACPWTSSFFSERARDCLKTAITSLISPLITLCIPSSRMIDALVWISSICSVRDFLNKAIAFHTALDYQQNNVTLRNSRQQPSDQSGGLAHSESQHFSIIPNSNTPNSREIPTNSTKSLSNSSFLAYLAYLAVHYF